MTFLDVLQACSEAGIRLAAKDGRLLVGGAEGGLTAALREQLTRHKAEILEYLAQPAAAPQTPGIRRNAGASDYPLSFSQRRLWFLDQLGGGSAEYNLPAAFRAIGALDVQALQATLDAIVARHEVLRTTYVLRGQEPVQVVQAPRGVALAVHDLSAQPQARREQQVQQLAVAEAARPFDLERDPPLRCTLLRLGEAEHVVLFTVHHIAADGWSMSVLVREFLDGYLAFRRGAAPQWAPLPVQYGDVAVAQHAARADGRLDAALEYWRQRLQDAPQVHALPLDRPRPARQRFAAARHTQRLARPQLEAIKALAAGEGATLFMALQSALAYLLARWSGEPDVLIATPTAGRAAPETARLIGCFNNTLACRFALDAAMSAQTLLAHGRDVALGAFSHQDVPFDLLVEMLRPERSLAYNPLCQIKFVLQNHEEHLLEIPGLALQPVGQGGERVHFDLDLTATERDDGLYLAWSFKQELFDAESIDRLAQAYARLLQRMCANPEMPLSRLGLLDEAGAQAAIALGRGADSAKWRQGSVLAGVAACALANAGAVAVRCAGDTLTYAALVQQSNRLAHALIEQGIGPGDRVGVHMGRSLGLPVALLAVMKAGAAYVPLDPGQGLQRLRGIVDAAAVGLVLHDGAHPLLLAGVDTILVDDLADGHAWFADYPDQAPPVAVGADDSAYVLYTSGSTGAPKGVEVAHRNLDDYCAFARESYYDAGLRGSLVATSPAFDLTLPGLFVPLLVGGTVELVAEDDLAALAARLAEPACPDSLLRLTPSHLHGVLALLGTIALPQRHVFVIGGEVLPMALAQDVHARFPAARLYNHYGPTETVVGCSLHAVDFPLPDTTDGMPIGRPMHNTQLYVLDPALHPTPIGVPGELYIGGAGVARGYLGQAALTAERFVADPFRPGQRVYRSGDRVRWRGDGQLEFLGRVDEQIKLRGFRIEPAEIELQLAACAGVRRAAVRVVGDAEQARLVGYLEAAATSLDLRDVLARLATVLPTYMVPASLVVLEALPLTGNGKVDKRALPLPQVEAGPAGDAPQTPTELRLAGLWAQLLKREQIGRDDHFFASGGHSLLATRLVGEIGRRLGRTLPVRAVFEHATLRELAAAVDALPVAAAYRIGTADRSAPLPLSFAQQSLWFVDLLEGGSPQFNMPSAMRLDGALDVDALQQALDALVERHEVLRTHYRARDGVPMQVVAAPSRLPIAMHDLRRVAVEEHDPRVQALKRDEARRPFDLANGPVLRCTLIRLQDRQAVLLLTLHHIASDGWSNGILARELLAFYTAFAKGEVPSLEALPVQYADYAAWQRQRLHGGILQPQLDYWRRRLADLPALHALPLDFPRPAQQDFAGVACQQALDAPDLARVRAFCQERGITLFVLMHAVFALWMGRLSRERDVVVGIPVAGRVHPDLEGLIGFFVNTLVLRTELDADLRFDALLAQCRTAAVEAYANQDIPFELLVDELKPVRSLSHNPLVQVLLNVFEPAQEAAAAPDGLDASALGGQASDSLAKADLTLYVRCVGEGLLFKWSGRRSLFAQASLVRFGDAFRHLLLQAIAAPDAPIADFALLDETAQRLTLDARAPLSVALDADCVHQRIAALAASDPAAVALRHGQQVLDRAELDARVRRLAAGLAAAGVGKGDIVGIFADRGIDYVVAVLASMHAGAVHLPIATELPAARIDYMLADGKARLVLTTTALAPRLTAAVPAMCVDAIVDAEPLPRPASDVGHADAVHLLYTSGSTGLPKGVLGSHRALCNRVSWMHRQFPFASDEVSCLITSTAFVRAAWELAVPLAAGCPVLIVDAETVADLRDFARLLHAQGVTRIVTAPSLALALVELPDAAQWLAGLRHWFVSGEPLKPQTAARIHATLPCVVLCNLYGSTETMSDVSYHIVERGVQADPVPIGRPIDNSALLVLDDHLRPLPAGVPGELCVAGANLALGYLARPQLTAEKFVGHRCGAAFGAVLYRTGDLARVLPDGRVECLGRLDHQVKVRGFRIELGEIESRLLRSGRVKDAVVQCRGSGDDARLVAYVVPVDDTDPELVATLRAELRAWLPEYMQPLAYVRMPQFPLTANGKVDRRALPEPEHDAAAHVPPSTATEALIAAIWPELLGTSPIGVDDDFFAIGGHSLLATRMASAITARTGKAVPVRAVFQLPTLAELARHVDGLADADHAAIAAVSRDGGVPLSAAQRRLWFVDRLEDGGAHYNLPTVLRLSGHLDGTALGVALNGLVQRHEILRTVYRERDGQVLQWVLDAPQVGIAQVDLSALDRHAQDAAVRRLCREEARAPFDLSADLMLRCTLLALGDDDHVLLFTTHHIASDGWSKGILVREFSALYAAAVEHRSAALPALPIQYGDYAAWQASPQQIEAAERDLRYWRQQLDGIPLVHALPLDRARPMRQDYRAARVTRHLAGDVQAQLLSIAQAQHATLFMLLHAAFAVLVSRWSGDADVVVGTPIAGRVRSEVEPLIGFFVNSLVLRTDLSDAPSFDTLLERSRETVVEAFAHQQTSFDALVETLQPERHPSHAPLYQLVIALQNHAQSTLALPGVEARAFGAMEPSIDVDVHLNVTESPDGLHFRWTYASSLFDASTIERLADSFLVLLSAVARDPQVPVLSLPLLPEDEARTLAQWSAPRPAPLPALCAHELVEAHARARPEALAVAFGEDHLDYGTLNAAANRVAHYLRAQGVGPDQLVGLCVERSLDLAIGMLGILKAGAGYLPLDPTYPHERLQAMLGEAGVAHVLSQQAVLEALPFLAEYTVLPLDAPLRALLLSGQPDSDLPVAEVGVTPDRLAYAIFTSGSTGTPKGVLLEHRGLINLAAYQQQALGLTARSRVLGFASASFDGAVFEWLMALASGASLHLCHEDERRSVELLAERLTASRITHAAIPPALLQQLPLARDYALELLIVAGERCDDALAWAWSRRCRVVNSYGPTEATVAATHAQVVDGEAMTLGRALPNVALRVLNAAGQQQPIGVSGELYLGGAGLARGYLGAPGLTAERFVTLPGQAMRLYRTGDLVRWRADGQLQFLGRADDQVKVRGFRIEPGEIASRLRQHDAVAEAAVVVREEGGEARLVAYVVRAAGLDAAMLRSHLRAGLPDYMVPAAFVFLDALPLNRNGKVDRARLPAPDYLAEQQHVAPEGDTQRRVAAIWQRVLKQETISATANFFEIGGHSLLATQVVSHVAEAFGREVPIRAVFERPTIVEFARHLDAAQVGRQMPVVLVPRDRVLPLSFSQQRLWFIDQLEGGSAQYNMRFGVLLRGGLDMAALQYALDTLVARHEVLRTTFATEQGVAAQVVQPPRSPIIEVHDLVELPATARRERLDAIARADASRAFDLSADLMLRCTVVALNADEHALLFATHHIASDGWSMNVLGKEFAQLYRAFRDGLAPELPVLSLQYADYACWQRAEAQAPVLQAQLRYWQHALADLPAVHALPLDRPRPARQRFDGGVLPRQVGAAIVQPLKRLALQHEASLFMALHAALAVVIGRWSNETDVVIGSPVAGRTQRQLEPLIGFFVNTLVLRSDLSGDPSFVEMLRRSRARALDAFANQDLPFEMLVEALRPERTLSHTPLYQISFTFHNHEQQELVLPGLDIERLQAGTQLARYDIEVHMTESDAGLHLRWVYATHLFDHATIARMADSFELLLAGAVHDPQAPVHALPIVSAEVAAQRMQAPSAVSLHEVLAHRLFEGWAQRTPDAVALVYEGEQLSYAQLNAEANRVAHLLRERGVRADRLVGLCMERSLDMIVGLMGILKAGGAYLPLDPSYPEARLRRMLQDSAVDLVLTQSAVLESLPMLGEVAVLPLDPEFRSMLLAGQPDTDPAPDAAGLSEASLAYVIYTSGSTGEPKGVMLEHRGLANLAMAQQQRFAITPDCRVLQFSSLNFDASTWDWLLALAHGAALWVCPQEVRLSADALSDYLVAAQITHALIPPAMLAHVDSERDYALRVLTVGGEACDDALAWRWARKCRVINAYGPSENTVVATSGEVTAGVPVTLGLPLPNCSAYVTNAHGCLAPTGVAGELRLGGVGLASGYLHAPDLTAQRFVVEAGAGPHPQRLYRTGDLVRWLANGELEFLGRTDEQVKLRGFRIELGEIEAALSAETPVSRAVVVLRAAADGGDKRLVAYVVPAQEADLMDPGALSTALRSALRQRLPDYMVPSAFVVLQALPISPSGKLDRAALPPPEAFVGAEYIAPATPTEIALCGLWAELLELDATAISASAGFFDLGGHSILAIRLVARVAARFAVSLNVRDLFQYPSLSELARYIDDGAVRPADTAMAHSQLHVGSDMPTVYWIPAAGMTAASYQGLAGALRGRLALRVLDPVQEDAAIPSTMAQTVAHHLQALRALAPNGPYLLAGHSFGGAVAFEMARVLERSGEPVHLLLVDSGIHLPSEQRARFDAVDPLQASASTEGGKGPSPRSHAQALATDAGAARECGDAQAVDRDVDRDALETAAALFRTQLAFYRTYQPQGMYHGPVTALLAREGQIVGIGEQALRRHYGRCISADVELREVAGGHLSMLSASHVHELAERLLVCSQAFAPAQST
ncbi:amino acid adenylation domain-containing protein [Xanthomonas campestris pv. cannae]|nr:amino acid adenylation domain-containing protein [Xanthomonas campestris pv. cannae]